MQRRSPLDEEIMGGLLVEAGESPEWETNDLMVPKHYLALNLSHKNGRSAFETAGSWKAFMVHM